MKLLHIIASVDPETGGPVAGIVAQHGATLHMNVERHVVSLDAPDAPFLTDFPLPVHALGPKAAGPLKRYGYAPRFAPWLKQNIGAYDAAIVEGLWNYTAFGAAMVLPSSRTPYFLFTHGMMDPWFRRRYPIKHLAKQGSWLLCEGRLLSGARAVWFTTEEERRLARGQFHGWPPYREEVVGFGACAPPALSSEQAQAFAAALPALAGRPYLLFLSRIHEKKGCDLLLDAFARHAAIAPDLQLVIAGPDQEGRVAALQARAKELGIDARVHWPGMLTGDAKWGAFYGARAFILPSHQENFGIVVAEALACGKPALITDKVNIWREVDDAKAGLIETDDVAGVSNLIARFLALAPEAEAAMSNHARACFARHFDVAATAPRLIESIKRHRAETGARR
ncbi:MAG: glycosyltransferase [Terricaulis sp.]